MVGRTRTLGLLLAVALAGCLTPEAPQVGPDETVLPLPQFLPPVAVSLEDPGAEPVVAVAPDGTIYVEGVGATAVTTIQGRPVRTNVNKVWRSTDSGETWTDITPQGPGQERSNDGFLAVAEDGTVYAANVFSLTFQVYRSDDRGDTWTLLNVPRLPLLMHRHWILPVGKETLHMSIESFPPEYGTYLAGQPTPVDPLDTPNHGMWYTRSEDRGETWTHPVQIDPNVNFAGQGNMVADAEGQCLFVIRYEEPGRTAYEHRFEEGNWYLIASHDGGDTWERTEMFPLTSELAAAIPATGLDSKGTLYAVWSQEWNGTSRIHYSYSSDMGQTWATPRQLDVGNGTHAMPWMSARDPGVLGVHWYQADDEGRASRISAPWFVDYALIEGADTPTPLVRKTRVTPDAIHDGNICAKGPACNIAEGEDRTLLDYPWSVFGPDGTAHLVFASTNWNRPSAFAVFAQEAAPLALAGAAS